MPVEKRILHLTLEKKWASLIADQKKPYDYREIKSFWISRLFHCKDMTDFEYHQFVGVLKRPGRLKSLGEILEYYEIKIKEYDIVKSVAGYGDKKPTIISKYHGFTFSDANIAIPKNDEPFKQRAFAIPVFDIIETRNWENTFK